MKAGRGFHRSTWTTAAFLIFSLINPVQAVEPAGRLAQTKGTVQIKNSAGAWVAAKKGDKLNPGQQLKTGPNSWAQITTKSEDKLQLSPKTTVELKEVSNSRTSIKVLLGRLRSIVKKLKTKRTFEVHTPVAVASVRGTEFDTDVDDNGKSTFDVYKGIVGVKDLEGIGAEISVFKNQRTVVEGGMAPLPPVGIERESRGELQERQNGNKEKELARLEAQREIAYEKFNEQLQSDVAHEQRLSEYQDGKTVIDAFGMRVRVEEYIVRPSPTQFSFVTINTRVDNVSFSRYDATAQNPLPPKLNDINFLFGRKGDGTGTDTPLNWIVRQKWFLSNGGDVYREWSEGGTPVYFSAANFWQVVYSDWYVELKGKEATNFRLVSHWNPTAGYLSGTGLGLSGAEGTELATDGALDIPHGYQYYSADANGTVGDTRPIDSVSFDVRKIDANIFGNATYQGSEGYARTSHAEFDGVKFSDLTGTNAKLNAIFNSKFASAVHEFDDPNSSSNITTLTSTQVNVDDLGNILTLNDRTKIGRALDSINFEYIANSPDFSSKIDLVLTPRIFKNAGLLEPN